jgi:hypothetical protein
MFDFQLGWLGRKPLPFFFADDDGAGARWRRIKGMFLGRAEPDDGRVSAIRACRHSCALDTYGFDRIHSVGKKRLHA